MKPKNKILHKFSLEKCKDGIIFVNSIPLFVDIENVAKQLQCEIWLDAKLPRQNLRNYII